MTKKRYDLEPDIEQARGFLSTLDPEANRFWFQALPERCEDNSLIRSCQSSLEECVGKLKDLNRNGAGIFVAINRLERNKSRKKENVNEVRAVFADIDHGRLEGVSEVLEPHIIHETSPDHYHVYWFVEEGLTKDEFRGVQKTISKEFDGDPVIDSCRLMRLPGFYHMKNEEPSKSRVIRENTIPRYPPERIVEAFPPAQNETSSTYSNDEATPEFVAESTNLSDDEILDRARSAENGEKFTKLFDEGDLSGFESHSEADASLVEILAFWVGPDPERIDRLFKQSALMREKWNDMRGSKTYGLLTIEEILGEMDSDDFRNREYQIDQNQLPELPSK